jgi:hypothetical protein
VLKKAGEKVNKESQKRMEYELQSSAGTHLGWASSYEEACKVAAKLPFYSEIFLYRRVGVFKQPKAPLEYFPIKEN